MGCCVVLGNERFGELQHTLKRLLRENIFVVNMIVKYIQPPFSVFDLAMEHRRSTWFDSLKVGIQELKNGTVL